MSLTPEEFKKALAQYPSGVTVITTRSPSGELTGLTVSAFCSLSLNPPLVLFCLAQHSYNYLLFQEAEGFAVHFLERSQEALSNLFAKAGEDKFDQVSWRSGLRDIPLLEDVVQVLECRITARYPGGDHTIVVGEVEAAHAHKGHPLVYAQGKYRGLH
ncbi:MAG: flavin reductase family protein [Deltaproteobacteria bacterium]|nr:flavin reductase family protein [Deltaproteobacteria bacterium]